MRPSIAKGGIIRVGVYVATLGSWGNPQQSMNSHANGPANPPRKSNRVYARPTLTPSRRRARLAVGVIAVALLIGAPLAGYYAVFVRPASAAIVQVNDVTYTRGDILERLRIKLYEAAEGRGSPVVNPLIAVRETLDEELVRQSAKDRGLVLDAAAVEWEVWRRVMGDVEFTTSDDRLQREFDELYRQYLLTRDIPEELHRRIIENELYAEVIRDQLAAEIGETAPQVLLARLSVASREQANEIGQRVADGERFVDIVMSAGDDGFGSAGTGWTPVALLDSVVAGAIAQLSEGELSKPVPNASGGVSLYAVVETGDARPLEAHHLEPMQQAAFDQWLAEEEARQDVLYELDAATYDWLIEQLRESRAPGVEGLRAA